MGLFDRKKDEDAPPPPPPPAASASDDAPTQQRAAADAPPPPPPTEAPQADAPPPPPPPGSDRPTWLDEEEDASSAPSAEQQQAEAPMRPEDFENRPTSDARVTQEEARTPGGPPDLANYDPSADAYNQNKIPGAAAREEYARSLVPPGGDINDEYRWHTGAIREAEGSAEDAVEFIEVHKAFGRNKILRGLNMGIPNDKISMILGPSGTGKSVCIKHMVGLLYPDDGDVMVHGESVPNMVDDRLFEVRKKFGVLFQDGALFGSMNLYDNVCFPLRQHTDKGEDEIEELVMSRLREVGLESATHKMPNELSGGMRKRAGFARALVLDPDIVLFDEP
ncbi:MAG: phospholipid/cholesterol/gamma-HCH transport system ATP-binding protein, partial [Solirubrobacteraceae bacterium]|nr:phospholipid/cholesterol/gamma-HCH transport system ATP-binding protein [Solirubrobacteraceae bacterium]